MDDLRLVKYLHEYDKPLFVRKTPQGIEIYETPPADWAMAMTNPTGSSIAYIPAMRPEFLGSADFRQAHGLKYAYIAGDMAHGISSTRMVIEMAKAGMMGFFGAGGLSLQRIADAIDLIQREVGDKAYGFNLLHNPFEPHLEEKTVDLYLRKGVTRVSASAYLNLTPYVVHYRARGLHRDEQGKIIAQHHVLAKISRSETARAFMSPAPKRILEELVQQGKLTPQEALLAEQIPVAEDLTAEADSGGHTDRRPFITLVPTICALRDQIMEEYRYPERIRVGGAGGMCTPHSLAAAFSMGADYVLTGSINQAALEADTSLEAKKMLAKAEPHDVRMAPAGDMFEMGVKVQVLKYGTMYPMRAEKLYQLYTSYGSLEAIPEKERQSLEKTILRKPWEEIWRETAEYWSVREPAQVERAQQDAHHQMALVFRWYLGKSSLWAKAGDLERKMDYQMWCGPAMGSFNEWARGTLLEPLENRHVTLIAQNLLRGACQVTRVHFLASQGVALPLMAYKIIPVEKPFECKV